MLDRKALFMNTLRKTAYAWKRIIELRLSGLSIFNSVVHSLQAAKSNLLCSMEPTEKIKTLKILWHRTK